MKILQQCTVMPLDILFKLGSQDFVEILRNPWKPLAEKAEDFFNKNTYSKGTSSNGPKSYKSMACGLWESLVSSLFPMVRNKLQESSVLQAGNRSVNFPRLVPIIDGAGGTQVPSVLKLLPQFQDWAPKGFDPTQFKMFDWV